MEQLLRVFEVEDRAGSTLSSALVTVSLLDYTEEVLQLIWGAAATSPALARKFVQQCLAI